MHSDISNLTVGTSADSVTKFEDYVKRAAELGMKAIAFSEHGNVINWVNKKKVIEEHGLKYIHASEIYLTKRISRDNNGKLLLERDNYHYMLIARNYDGVLELNKLVSRAFEREDGHFYYNPRVTFEELKNTSDNIIMTSACLASPIARLYKEAYPSEHSINQAAKQELEELLHWISKNKHRMFFEVQYHNHPEQIEYNRLLLRLSKEMDIPLIAGTDTHALNKEHAETRKIYMKAKGVKYGDEDVFDLTFKTYNELVEAFEEQGALPKKIYLEAIENTNVMADMIETFELDNTPKYPKLYDNPIETFKQKIQEGVKKRGIDKLPKEQQKVYLERIKEEFDTYVKLNAVDYMLLQKNIIDWCHENGIYQGYGRGSVNGSLIAYLLGITEMDSVKHKLNFFRFLNPDRISMPDIDVDYSPSRRQEVINYVSNLKGIHFAEIITLNTVALKGAIREVGRGLDMPYDEVDEIAKNAEYNESYYREQYPELFRHVDVLKGVIVSMGSHPSGFLVSPISLDDNIGTIYTKESKHRVSAINMKELDSLNYVKLDILGLDNIELINETCKLAGIERLTPDNVDVNDINVWKSLRESTLGVFQMESDMAHAYLKRLFSDETLENIHKNVGEISYIDLLSMANGAIRPSGESFRDQLAQGIVKDNGHEAINEFLRPRLGQLLFQEDIMQFLVKFCEHTNAEADLVRRGIAKKGGTEKFLPIIEERFIHHMTTVYGETEERAREIVKPLLKVIDDAKDYGFSLNHSQPYSYIGYIGAYLRYYYPLEFLTVLLNIHKDDIEKTAEITEYARKRGIEIKPIRFGKSRADYSCDKKENVIYKGIASIKYLNRQIAEELYQLSQEKEYDRNDFVSLLIDIFEKTSVDTRAMQILIRLDFFKDFGEKEVLLEIYQHMADLKKPTYPEFAKKPLKYDAKHKEKTKMQRINNLKEFEQFIRNNPPQKIDLYDHLMFEKEIMGKPETKLNVPGNVAIVLAIDKRYTPKLTLYKLKTGEQILVKVEKNKFWENEFEDWLYVGDIIQVKAIKEKYGWRKGKDGKWEVDKNKIELFLDDCKIIKRRQK